MAKKARHQGIIVIGPPRSGTTLLRRLLNAHPDIACPGETNLLSACARFLSSERIAEGVDIGVLTGLSYAGFGPEEVIRRLREFVFAFHEEHARREGKRRWAEKTAFDSFHLDRIEALCGDQAYFICMIRHGLDVACSIQELCEKNQTYLSELHEYVKRYPRPLEAFAHVWVDLTTGIREFVQRHPDSAVMMRYEDLIANTQAEMARVIEFVGESWNPKMLERAMQDTQGIGLGDWKTYARSDIDGGSIDRWKQLSRATISQLGRIVNPTLGACGYAPVEVEDRIGEGEARRRYELGLLVTSIQKNQDSSNNG